MEPDYTEEQLSAMTKAQLLEVAEGLGISGVSGNMTKAQIITRITEA